MAAVFCALVPVIGLISPIFQLLALMPSGILAGRHWAQAGFTWWIGEAVGMLTVTPLILVWAGPGTRLALPTMPRAAEGLVAAALLVVGAVLGFGALSPWHIHDTPLLFMAFPPIFWILFRFGPRATTAAVAARRAVWLSSQGDAAAAKPAIQNSVLVSLLPRHARSAPCSHAPALRTRAR